MEIARRALVLWIAASLPSLAQEAARRGEPGLAALCLETYLSVDPDSPQAHVQLGWAYAQTGDLGRAKRAYTEAIRLDPNRVPAYVGRACVAGTKGELDDAVGDLEAALRLDPDCTAAYYNRGLAFAQKRQFDPALADFGQVVRRLPDQPDAYYNRGVVLAEMGHRKRAVADFAQVVRLEPGHHAGRLALVDLLATAPEASVCDLPRADEEAARLDPRKAGTHRAFRTLAAAHARRGELDLAVSWQRKALACAGRLDKDDRRRAELVLRLYRQRKKEADRDAARQATRAAPPDGP